MEAVLEDNSLERTSLIKKSPSRLILLNWRNGRNVWLEQRESSWSEFEITMSRASMGRRLRFQCGKH